MRRQHAKAEVDLFIEHALIPDDAVGMDYPFLSHLLQ